MNLFGEVQAKHFCRALIGPPSHPSVKALLSSSKPTLLTEGTTPFEDFRAASLVDAERYLFLTATHYRRALDLLAASSAPWAHVSLYYGAFFAAKGLLAMFGGYCDGKGTVVDVAVAAPGQQALRVQRKAPSPTGLNGSHGAFWDHFYEGARTLTQWADASLAFCLAPNISRDWLTIQRNLINYHPDSAFDLIASFHANFKRTRASLSGPLATQLNITEALAKVAMSFASSFSLTTPALDCLGHSKGRAHHIRKFALQGAPRGFQASFQPLALAR